jgi:hypothetical protein
MAKEPLFKIDPGSEVTASGTGYIYVTTTPNHPGKKMPDHDKTYVYKHIVLMENHIGRLLKKDEFVHHKDENKANNKMSNLELTTRKEHGKHHVEHGNKFWKHSPRTKPGKKRKAQALRVASRYLEGSAESC